MKAQTPQSDSWAYGNHLSAHVLGYFLRHPDNFYTARQIMTWLLNQKGVELSQPQQRAFLARISRALRAWHDTGHLHRQQSLMPAYGLMQYSYQLNHDYVNIEKQLQRLAESTPAAAEPPAGPQSTE